MRTVKLDHETPGRDENKKYLSCHHLDLNVRYLHKNTGRYLYLKDDPVFPKIRGKPPKWMVKIMENPIFLMDDLEVQLFLETPISQVRVVFPYVVPLRT